MNKQKVTTNVFFLNKGLSMKKLYPFIVCFMLMLSWTANSQNNKSKEPKKIKRISLERKRSGITNKALKQAIQLNYITVSLTNINNYNDKIVLQQELDTIINNLDISQIEAESIIESFQNLIRLLTKQTLTESEKMKIAFIYEHKMSNALEDSFNPANIIAGGLNPWTAIAETAGNLGGAVMDYRKAMKEYQHQLALDNWKLDDATFAQINMFREEFLGNAWEVMKEYQVDGSLRLTESQIEKYINYLKDTDAARKYNSLLAIKKDFNAYPPFWYHLGAAAQSLSKKNKAMKAKALEYYQFFEDRYYGLIKYDNTYASLCMNRIILNGFKNDKQTLDDLEKIIENAPGDWNKLTFVASTYAKLGLKDKAEKVLRSNIDNLTLNIENKSSKIYNPHNINQKIPVDEGEAYILSMNTKLLTLLLKEQGDTKGINKLLDKIIEKESYKIFEALFLVGLMGDERYLTKLKPLLDKVVLKFNLETWSTDILTVSIPLKLFLKANAILVQEDDNVMPLCAYQNGTYSKVPAMHLYPGFGTTGIKFDDKNKYVNISLHLEANEAKKHIIVSMQNGDLMKLKLFYSTTGDNTKPSLQKLTYFNKAFEFKNGKVVRLK